MPDADLADMTASGVMGEEEVGSAPDSIPKTTLESALRSALDVAPDAPLQAKDIRIKSCAGASDFDPRGLTMVRGLSS